MCICERYGLQRGNQLFLVMTDFQINSICELSTDNGYPFPIPPLSLFFPLLPSFSLPLPPSLSPSISCSKTRPHCVAQVAPQVAVILFLTLEHGLMGVCPARLPGILLDSKQELG